MSTESTTLGPSLLDKVRASVAVHYDGEYMTRCWSVNADGSYDYKTLLWGPDGPVIFTRVCPDGSMVHQDRG